MDNHNFNMKDIWQGQKVSAPDVEEILANVRAFKRDNFRKMVLAFISQIIPIIATVFVLIYVKPMFLTTKLGIILLLVAIVLYLFQYGSFYSYFQKLDNMSSNKVYLQNLITLKEKQRNFQTKFLSLYYVIIIVALHFYLYQPASSWSLRNGILVYLVTFLWVAFTWFYLRPKTIKSNEAKINPLIEHYSKLSQQFES